MAVRQFFCTFPQALIQEPIISHTLNTKFGVIPNIRSASISDTKAVVKVEIEGPDTAVDQAVHYMKERGVNVEEMGAGQDRPLE
jgi:L-aspartate semialdehyde sulfurtransferase ferredoxin